MKRAGGSPGPTAGGAWLVLPATVLVLASAGCAPLVRGSAPTPPPLARLFAPAPEPRPEPPTSRSTSQATSQPASRRALPPQPISPFSDAPTSFVVRGVFTRGELVIVRVCLAPDHSIASASIIESSGDHGFDEQALAWARQVRLRSAPPPDGTPVARCGAVRVEIRDIHEPPLLAAPAGLLG